MKPSFLEQCLDILKTEDIQKECKKVLKQCFDFIFLEMNLYIHIIFTILFVNLLFQLMIFIFLLLVWRQNYLFSLYKVQ